MTVFNPGLYAALKTLNGGEPPRITSLGVPASFTVTYENGKPKIHGSGEQYVIRCPVCNDKRYRLYVHHCFGQVRHVPDFNKPGEQLLPLAYCQHCQKRIRLVGYLEGYAKAALNSPADTLAFLNSQSSAAPPVRKCPPMGNCVPLHEVDKRDPAVLYLLKRRYNIEYLGKVAGAVVMLDHPDGAIARMVRGRIGFPFYVDGELKTWQARLPYDQPKSEKWPPKWYFPPMNGLPKLPWNVDVASQFPVVILCEGILSAVNMGPAAVAVGGKTLTTAALEIVKKKWSRALVAMDPDAGINRKPGEIDYQKRMIDQLEAAGIRASGITWTPGDNRDPGDLTPGENIELIRRSDPTAAAALSYVGTA
jgi:hypothetical protein